MALSLGGWEDCPFPSNQQELWMTCTWARPVRLPALSVLLHRHALGVSRGTCGSRGALRYRMEGETVASPDAPS